MTLTSLFSGPQNGPLCPFNGGLLLASMVEERSGFQFLATVVRTKYLWSIVRSGPGTVWLNRQPGLWGEIDHVFVMALVMLVWTLTTINKVSIMSSFHSFLFRTV